MCRKRTREVVDLMEEDESEGSSEGEDEDEPEQVAAEVSVEAEVIAALEAVEAAAADDSASYDYDSTESVFELEDENGEEKDGEWDDGQSDEGDGLKRWPMFHERVSTK